MSTSHDSSAAHSQEPQLYLRRQGRITGPYQLKLLRKMSRRAQLSRFHEASWDGYHWAPAGEFDELFGNPAAGHDSQEMIEQIVPIEEIATEVENPAPEVSQEWFYEKQGQPMGPISFESLLELIATGGVLVTTRVWADGLPDWAPAKTIAALQPATRAKTAGLPTANPADLSQGGKWS